MIKDFSVSTIPKDSTVKIFLRLFGTHNIQSEDYSKQLIMSKKTFLP